MFEPLELAKYAKPFSKSAVSKKKTGRREAKSIR